MKDNKNISFLLKFGNGKRSEQLLIQKLITFFSHFLVQTVNAEVQECAGMLQGIRDAGSGWKRRKR